MLCFDHSKSPALEKKQKFNVVILVSTVTTFQVTVVNYIIMGSVVMIIF